MMNINDMMSLIDQHIPLAKAESWDNVGLLIGDEQAEVSGILTALDCTTAIVDEAVERGCNTIICHHPLIFSGIKSIQESGYGQVIRQLIRHDINLIALHTNLDAHPYGVSYMIGERLQLKEMQVMLPERRTLAKLQIFVPEEAIDALKAALSDAGGGKIGDYSDCFFQTQGQGQFKPNDQADPYIGSAGRLEVVDEFKLECVFNPEQRRAVERAIMQAHPYEEPAYDIYTFEVDDAFGTGIIGQLPDAVPMEVFAEHIKQQLELSVVKVIGDKEQLIQTVGIIGGAGIDYVQQVNGRIDVFLTGDIKYHEAHNLLMEGLPAIDITHYAEHVMIQGLPRLLQTFIADIDIYPSQLSTDPFHCL